MSGEWCAIHRVHSSALYANGAFVQIWIGECNFALTAVIVRCKTVWPATVEDRGEAAPLAGAASSATQWIPSSIANARHSGDMAAREALALPLQSRRSAHETTCAHE
jgi:hypothetical protein